MKSIKSIIFSFTLALCLAVSVLAICPRCTHTTYADTDRKYWTIYDTDDTQKIVFVRGDAVEDGDMYISAGNKLYEIVNVDANQKVAYAKFIKDEQMPKYSVKRKTSSNQNVAQAAVTKRVGLYHTHNDESYTPTDGYDSVYGKGGIHDVGARIKSNLNKLGIEVDYSEDLHLPHNSGAYTRSQVTASKLINGNKLDGLFDIHRDSTPVKEYQTTVNGISMCKIRMVVGSGNANMAENKEFAKSIKAYADEVYPGLIKDIYIGRGNYNQQLTPRAMLFELGCDLISKDLVLKSCEPIAKTIDVVLFGSNNASDLSLDDVSLVSADGSAAVITGLAFKNSAASVSFVWILLGGIAFYFAVLGIVCIFSRTARYKTARFFSELFAGLFGKKKARR